MRVLPLVSALAVLSAATSCVAPPRAAMASPPPAPARAAKPERAGYVVEPPVPATPVAMPADWRDWPQTRGDWRYETGRYGTTAEFGQPGRRLFDIACDRGNRQVTLTSEQAPDAPTMTVRTTSTTRVLAVVAQGHPPTGGSAPLSANDPLLDAIGFSRGRFVVEQPGAPALVLPAWAEVERVVQDCRD